MGNFTIRPAKVSDAHQIAIVHVETWQYAYKGQIPDSYLQSLSVEVRARRWTEMIQKSEESITVGETDGKIVGWCTAGKSRDKDANEETGEVYGIYVHPDYIGKGLGSQLMDHAIESLRQTGFKKATLWVLETNTKSKAWYESKGWRLEGSKKIDDRGDIQLHEIRYTINL